MFDRKIRYKSTDRRFVSRGEEFCRSYPWAIFVFGVRFPASESIQLSKHCATVRRLLWQRLHSSRWAALWWASWVEWPVISRAIFHQKTRGGKTGLVAWLRIRVTWLQNKLQLLRGYSIFLSFIWVNYSGVTWPHPKFCSLGLENLTKMAQ